jgi:hypothetical protein
MMEATIATTNLMMVWMMATMAERHTSSSGAPDGDAGIQVEDSFPETHEYNSNDEDSDEYELKTYSEREQDGLHELKYT